MTPPTAAFLDSNIWLYAFISGQDPQKRAQALALIADTSPIVVSTQVINEVCVNLLRKQRATEQAILDLIDDFYGLYTVVPSDQHQFVQASTLRTHYTISYWDSLIVAAALAARVPILYSEDMQDGLIVDGSLRIVNPFRHDPA